MDDPWLENLRGCVEDIKVWRAELREHPNTAKARLALMFLKREADAESGRSHYYYALRMAGMGDEVKKLHNVARKLLNIKSLEKTKKSKAGRKSKYPDGPDQVEVGFLYWKKKRTLSASQVEVWIRTEELPRRNGLVPPEWMNGYPINDQDLRIRDKARKALRAAIDDRIKKERAKTSEIKS